MNDFVFYKKRKFGDLISDTFTFFRKYAGNYFSNYLVINGAAIVSAGILFAIFVWRDWHFPTIGTIDAGYSIFLVSFCVLFSYCLYRALGEKS